MADRIDALAIAQEWSERAGAFRAEVDRLVARYAARAGDPNLTRAEIGQGWCAAMIIRLAKTIHDSSLDSMHGSLQLASDRIDATDSLDEARTAFRHHLAEFIIWREKSACEAWELAATRLALLEKGILPLDNLLTVVPGPPTTQ